jgi:hypothetical protein
LKWAFAQESGARILRRRAANAQRRGLGRRICAELSLVGNAAPAPLETPPRTLALPAHTWFLPARL